MAGAFKVGDRVRALVAIDETGPFSEVGMLGEVVRVDPLEYGWPYVVRRHDSDVEADYDADELELA